MMRQESEMSEEKRGIEEIKNEIAGLIREAGLQGVAIDVIRSKFIDTIEGKAHLACIEIEERRMR